MSESKFIKPWRTVEIGRHQNADRMIEVLEVAGCCISDWARGLLPKVQFAPELQTLTLVCATVAQLGFPKGATTRQIVAAGLARGWQLCLAEIGPALREQYADQPQGEQHLIAMEPIIDSDNCSAVFRLMHDDDGYWLCGSLGHPGHRQHNRRWVFVLPEEK